MFKPCDILVTSSRVEDRRALMNILDGLPINVFSSSTVKQAEEVMSQKKLALVFCDEHLPDGSYRELFRVLALHPSSRAWWSRHTPASGTSSWKLLGEGRST